MEKRTLHRIMRPEQMRETAEGWRRDNLTIALVPTMGFLHEGHLNLIRQARVAADKVVVSIFVNPIQFGAGEDFEKYPRDLQNDLALLATEGVDALFEPRPEDIYGPHFQTRINVTELSQGLCGAARPGHFEGVATVVGILFNLVRPHIAIFGAKDYQQAAVVRRMSADLHFGIEIVVAPIIREASGLAMSSRNSYLSDQERAEATVLYQSLHLAEKLAADGERQAEKILTAVRDLIDSMASTRIDYIALVDTVTLEPVTQIEGDVQLLLAVFVGSTRLIDNCRINIE